ncbi:cytochrome P450 6g1-like [Lutzomyia longipalpis]|uniref:cytochrome P450 6g1-like n=1 Tax=Lutzomyia longipalpis TaxID=7200 RepID=UPI0024834CEA|nr:cytochrome P450 6g1-like [Lutzomyia longipalpis]
MIFASLATWIGIKKYLKYFWTSKGVSYVAGPPLVGVISNVLLNKTSFSQLFLDLYNHPKTKKDAVTGFYFFHKACLLVRHPKLFKRILVKDFNQFPDRRMSSDPKSDPIGMNTLVNVKGDTWRNIRNHITPVFTVHKIKNFFPLLIDVCVDLEAKLSEEIPQGSSKEINLKELAGLYTVETIASCAFGVKPNCFQNPNADFLKKAQRVVDPGDMWRVIELGACFFFPEFASVFGLKFYSKETDEFLRTAILDVMQEREKSGEKRHDLIDALITMKNTQKEIFHMDALIAQAAVFLAAGYETSSSVLSFALYELARHQDLQEKLRNELLEHREHGEMSYESFNNLQYLHMVFQETLRLYPSIPFLERTCQPADGKASYSLEPYHKFSIPRGMPIYIPAIAVQRDPNFFPDPLTFSPERFAPDAEPRIDHNLLLGFGQGPRNCLGSRFGTLQVKMALATIIPKYQVEFCSRTPHNIVFNKKSVPMFSEEPIFLSFVEI